MLNKNQQMFENWLRSVIDRHFEHMVEMIADYKTVWISEPEYEIEASGSCYHSFDPGNYWTPPYSELVSWDIDGKLFLFRPDGETFEVEFRMTDKDKVTQIQYKLS